MKIKSPRALTSALGALLLSSVAAQGVVTLTSFDINCFDFANGENVGQIALTGTIQQVGSNVTLTLTNSTSYIITDIYIDDIGDSSASFLLLTAGGASFTGANPGGTASYQFGNMNPANFADGSYVPPFVTDYGFGLLDTTPQGAEPNGVDNGLNNGESATFTFTGSAPDQAAFNAIWDNFVDGNIRIGVHVQAIPQGEGSAWYLNCEVPPRGDIPEPTAAALGLIGTVLLLRRRRD